MQKLYGTITGWGKYIPETVVTNDDLAQRIDTSDAWIQERTGIKERHLVNTEEHTSQMATEAAKRALEIAQIPASEVDLIIAATSSPDYLTPPVSSQIQHNLGATKAGAFTLVTGCTGFVYGLVTAQQFIASGVAKHVVIIGVEIISRMLDWNDRNTCVLFGDGAAAVVLSATEEPEGVLASILGSDGSGYEHIIHPSGGTRMPPTAETLAAGLGYIKMNGREVFKFATRIMIESLDALLTKSNLTIEDIDLLIPHQANARIIEYAAHKAKLPPEKVFMNVAKYGNTSAASVPIAFCEAIEENRIKQGDMLAMIAFGAGLTWAGAMVKMGNHPQLNA